MENKFVIDFNGHGVETDLSDKPKVSEELEDDKRGNYLLAELYDLGENTGGKESILCILAERPYLSLGLSLHLPTQKGLYRVDALLERFFGSKALQALLNKRK